MEKENIIKTKTYKFALNTIKLFRELQNEKEFVLSKQLLRSATSIGANVEEGIQAQSKSDFIHEFSIAQKESYEAHYWLQLLSDSKYLTQNQSQPLIEECIEIQKIITAILKTSKQ
jgi:four helix bundle protein